MKEDSKEEPTLEPVLEDIYALVENCVKSKLSPSMAIIFLNIFIARMTLLKAHAEHSIETNKKLLDDKNKKVCINAKEEAEPEPEDDPRREEPEESEVCET